MYVAGFTYNYITIEYVYSLTSEGMDIHCNSLIKAGADTYAIVCPPSRRTPSRTFIYHDIFYHFNHRFTETLKLIVNRNLAFLYLLTWVGRWVGE